MSTHARRRHIHDNPGIGEHLADAIAVGMGSWRFIILQSIIVAFWAAANIMGFLARWDPYPFILLNLLFSTQAAYAAPIIMMAQNRQAAKDRLRDDTEAQEVEAMFKLQHDQIETLRQLDTMQAEQMQILAAQNKTMEQQTEMLQLLRAQGGGVTGGNLLPDPADRPAERAHRRRAAGREQERELRPGQLE